MKTLCSFSRIGVGKWKLFVPFRWLKFKKSNYKDRLTTLKKSELEFSWSKINMHWALKFFSGRFLILSSMQKSAILKDCCSLPIFLNATYNILITISSTHCFTSYFICFFISMYIEKRTWIRCKTQWIFSNWPFLF